jgi:hypothetical protein
MKNMNLEFTKNGVELLLDAIEIAIEYYAREKTYDNEAALIMYKLEIKDLLK